MAIRQLRQDEDAILRKKCKEVTEIDEKILMILDDMLETLHSIPNSAAIAANQVGILKRLVVIDMGEGIIKLVNPVIIEAEGQQDCTEGCLSFPGKFGTTIRPQKVTVKALNENGEEIIITGEGDLAKCFCHELDHLDGEVFIDKVIEFLDV
ncbi:peptide deformylase [Acetobacterium woodii]|uniref:Peptide deformylase n=1 Tax=Acetobacterium woodii (strain ATCC 29683 / DSM 1030 / JCM 2381 / KCTC 1655 / WB1) TaxID=931626 RepID=H6LHL7_ACEWD|nr:peptide deformylase [Acetobacterium woodii]AFA47196.1 peptide deformylase Def [Acetobacterium woodii DSM 1030]